MNLYETLEITQDEKKLQGKDFEDVVKRQYRNFAKQCHPDKFQDPKEKAEAETKFKKIAEAKEVLSDPQKRYQYDMTGSTSGFNYSNFNTHDGLDDILDAFFKRSGFGHTRRGEQSYKGGDAIIRITIDIKDAYQGVEKKYKYKRKVVCTHCDGGSTQTCPSCHGTGVITTTQRMGIMGVFQQTSTCPHCQGTGKTYHNNNSCHYCNNTGLEEIEEVITVQIPKGVTKDMTLVNKGMGHQLPKGYTGNSGDLKIVIGNINSQPYEIDGYHLIRRLDVPILDIITGTNVEIVSPIGERIKVEIPKNCPTNTALKLVGYGIPIGNHNRSGDIYVVVNHKFPTTLDKNDRKKIDELKTRQNFK